MRYSQYSNIASARTWFYPEEIVADMSSETNLVLVNAEFTTEQAHSGLKSIKLNIPADGTSSITYTFPAPIDFRNKSLKFRLKAINENASALNLGEVSIYVSRSTQSDIALRGYSSAMPITGLRPIGAWVTENVIADYDSTRDNAFINEWAYVTGVRFVFGASAANAVTLYFDTISLQLQPNIPTAVLISADDGYLNYGTLAANVANSYGIPLSCAVTKNFIEAGEHTITGVTRPCMNYTQLAAFAAAGNEVTNHSKTHPSIILLNEAELTDEVLDWSNELIALGYDPVSAKVFIPPGGGVSDLSTMFMQNNMLAQRNPRFFNDFGKTGFLGIDLFNLTSKIYEGASIETIDFYFDNHFPKHNSLVIFYGHDIHTEDVAPHDYSTHIDVFTYLCEKIHEYGLQAITYKDLIQSPNIWQNCLSRWDYESRQIYLKSNESTFLADNIKLPDSPHIHYDMESGDTLVDKSGNNYHGTLTNITFGTNPNRIIKTATTSRVSVPVAAAIGNSEFTIIAAIRINVVPDAYQAFYFESRNANYYYKTTLTMYSDATIRTRTLQGMATSSFATPTGKWVIAVGRRDLTTEAGKQIHSIADFHEDGRRFYKTSTVDYGELEGTEPKGIYLFESVEGVGNELGCLIIYKRLLTDAEVMQAVRYLAPTYEIKHIL